MDLAAINSDKKCIFGSLIANRVLAEEYMVEVCKTSRLDVKSEDERIKENFLLSVLLDNIEFLNYRDCADKRIVNCDLNKIAHLK